MIYNLTWFWREKKFPYKQCLVLFNIKDLWKVFDYLKLPKIRKMSLRLKVLLSIQWIGFRKDLYFDVQVLLFQPQIILRDLSKICLMYKRWAYFYIIVINCQFFQATHTRLAIQNWKLASSITRTRLFNTPRFSYLPQHT